MNVCAVGSGGSEMVNKLRLVSSHCNKEERDIQSMVWNACAVGSGGSEMVNKLRLVESEVRIRARHLIHKPATYMYQHRQSISLSNG